ncbi:MAG: hypothetical protein WBE42_20525, partial [Pseudolabrys sp.]|jgi:hypothetical protein
MSAFGSKADMTVCIAHVRFCPKADIVPLPALLLSPLRRLVLSLGGSDEADALYSIISSARASSLPSS